MATCAPGVPDRFISAAITESTEDVQRGGVCAAARVANTAAGMTTSSSCQTLMRKSMTRVCGVGMNDVIFRSGGRSLLEHVSHAPLCHYQHIACRRACGKATVITHTR